MNQNRVQEFENMTHQHFNSGSDLFNFRWELLKDQVINLEQAELNEDRHKIVAAYMEMLYVLYGASISYGIVVEVDCNIDYERKKSNMPLTNPRHLFNFCKNDTWAKQYFTERNINGMIYAIYEIIYNSNFNADKCFDIVHQSNMAKFVDQLADEDLQNPDLKYCLRDGKYVIWNRNTFKIQKPAGFKEPEFDL